MGEKIERAENSLQIDEDLNLHIKGWIFQRVGWALMLIFLICALLGLFGDGILSKRELVVEGSTIHYERFSRYDNKSQLEILSQHRDGKIEVVMPPVFAASFEVENVVPEPAKQKMANGSMVYEFEGEGTAQLTFFLNSRQAGSVNGTIQVNDTGFELKQYIFP
jgi:hypothetical protein